MQGQLVWSDFEVLFISGLGACGRVAQETLGWRCWRMCSRAAAAAAAAAAKFRKLNAAAEAVTGCRYETGFLKPFLYINDHFTKTGSGQTQGKRSF
eukprot:COSAG06_NODE_1256_length_10087_cov_7.646676_3_plen_96_part_00